MKAADKRPMCVQRAKPSEPAILGTRSGATTQAPPAMRQRSAGSERKRERQKERTQSGNKTQNTDDETRC